MPEKIGLGKIQLGKNKITDNFMSSLKNLFKKHKSVKISVLRSAKSPGKEGRDEMKKYAEEILNRLGKNYTSRVIGFTISLKKWRKDMR